MQQLTLLALTFLLAPFSATAAPNIDSESYLLMDAATGAVIVEKNADARLPPASLTKIMTAYMVFRALDEERLTMRDFVHISPRAWAAKVTGSKTFIEVNTQVSVHDLLYGLVVQSGNDAAIALAEELAGDEAAFAEEMNRQAQFFQLRNTHFVNATGLPHEKQYSSARDVALMVRRTVQDYPRGYAIYKELEFEYNGIRQLNRNRLLTSFRGADGVKTGHTQAAGYCLAASAVRDGRRLISVVMQTDSPRARERQSAKLLNYGFSATKNVHLFEQHERRQLPIFKGVKSSLAVHPANDGIFTVDKTGTLKTRFRPQTPLLAPVAKNDAIGVIEIIAGEAVIHTVTVVADEPVAEAGFFAQLLDDIKINFLGHAQHNDLLLSEW